MNIPEEKQLYFEKIALNLIRASEEFKSILQSQFPDIYADIQSASTNPNCSCVRKVEKKLKENKEICLNLLNNYLSDKDNVEQIKQIIDFNYKLYSAKTYSGRVFAIKNTEEAFQELLDNINQDRGTYRTFSTAIHPNGDLYVYFL
jgi:hypothetical protein